MQNEAPLSHADSGAFYSQNILMFNKINILGSARMFQLLRCS